MTLHLHVRIVATPEIKEVVRKKRDLAARRRFERRMSESVGVGADRDRNSKDKDTMDVVQLGLGSYVPSTYSGSSRSRVRRRTSRSGSQPPEHAVMFDDERRREKHEFSETGSMLSRTRHRRFSSRSKGAAGDLANLVSFVETGGSSASAFYEDEVRDNGSDRDEGGENGNENENENGNEDVNRDGDGEGELDRYRYEEVVEEDESDGDVLEEWDEKNDNNLPSIIPNPGQATPLQRKWIEAMSDDQPEELARRFRLYVHSSSFLDFF